jgi:hypothetical protein
LTRFCCDAVVEPRTAKSLNVIVASVQDSPSASGAKPSSLAIDGVDRTMIRSRAFAMPSSSSSGPRTIHAPAAPEATWIAVVPWMCGWYHCRPV